MPWPEKLLEHEVINFEGALWGIMCNVVQRCISQTVSPALVHDLFTSLACSCAMCYLHFTKSLHYAGPNVKNILILSIRKAVRPSSTARDANKNWKPPSTPVASMSAACHPSFIMAGGGAAAASRFGPPLVSGGGGHEAVVAAEAQLAHECIWIKGFRDNPLGLILVISIELPCMSPLSL